MVEVDVRDKGFTKKLLLNENHEIMKQNLTFLPITSVDLRTVKKITGLIIAEEIRAKISVPNFNRSMMDGYAVTYDDVMHASLENPIELPIVGENYMGRLTEKLQSNSTIKVPTGGMVPEMADTVIKLEDIEIVHGENDKRFIKITSIPEKGKNVSLIGDDFKSGEIILQKKTRLTFTDIGAILSVGVFVISCYKIPNIAIFPTGDEIIDTNEKLKLGQVYDSTTYIVREMCEQLGFDLTRFSGVRDDKDKLTERIIDLTEEFDIILMTGGTSVGKKDYIPIIIDEIGELLVHGASVRPGSPITAGIRNKKLIIGLPGFPVSTISSFVFFVIPLVFYMLGDYKFEYPTVKAELTHSVNSKKGRRDFLRVKLEKTPLGKIEATPIMIAGSSLLSTINKADGIIIVEEEVEQVTKGNNYQVVHFNWLGKFS